MSAALSYNRYQYSASTRNSGYLIDDVSVIESDLKADAGPDRYIGRGDSTYIGRPKEVGLECTWTVQGSSTVVGTGAGLWVKPQNTTRYVVTQTLCGAIKKDTVWVGVWGVGVPGASAYSQSYTLAPNPSNGAVQLTQSVQDARPVCVQVVEAAGRIVYAGTAAFSGGTAELDLSALAPGVYFVQLKDRDGNVSALRMLKQ